MIGGAAKERENKHEGLKAWTTKKKKKKFEGTTKKGLKRYVSNNVKTCTSTEGRFIISLRGKGIWGT